ncbi:hypothetical protein [Nocardia farcinica]|uniref:hypothetical protein n=1 Tax=Nocardia farcinica TaxID=37329 RepID=UPI0018952C49|nr:hypothetical protein [Nocardia farcinica]MBF6522817.1 hypothetical protein [Nocardia farcinica]
MRKLAITTVTALAFGAGLLTPAIASAAPAQLPAVQVEPIARHTATVKCQLVKHGGEATGYITGTGTGKTKPDAVAAAKKDADRSVPQGYYKRHCKEI